MSKYTMSLGEYLLDGYTLPSSFNQITDFDDLFVGYYYNSEIGFETPELFEIRLAVKAEMIMPIYASRISAYNSILETLGTPDRVITTATTTSGTNSGTQTNSGSDSIVRTGTDTLGRTGTDTLGRTGTDSVGHTGSVNAGAQTRYHYDLPINASTGTPTAKDASDAYANSDSFTDTTTHGTTDTTTHNTTDTTTHNTTDTTNHGLSVSTSGTNSGTSSTTQSFTGLDINEQLALFNEYKSKVLNLKQSLLDEFKPLFMTIY